MLEMIESPRQGLGTFFRALVDFVEQRQLLSKVREQVSPETRAMIDHPPRALSFIPSTSIDEIEVALEKVAGQETLVECGLACARPLGWSLIQPVLRMAFQLFGQSPEAIFGNLDRFFSLAVRGISFGYEAQGKGGTVMARFDGDDTPAAAFHVLRGTLIFVFEASGTTGEVDPPEMVESTPAGVTVRYRVRWS
jgi:hypothetical protein